MITLHSTQCCGVGEINNLSTVSTAEEAMRQIAPLILEGLAPPTQTWRGRKRLPIITFTGVVDRVLPDHASGRHDNYGQAFAAYIMDHRLGTVQASNPGMNWTGNTIKLWAWSPDYNAIQRWLDNDAAKVRS